MNRTILSLLLAPLMVQAGNYSAQRATVNGIEIIQLRDGAQKIEVSIAPSLSNNAFNLAHAGLYGELQSVPPGGVWKESFWIIPEGYN